MGRGIRQTAIRTLPHVGPPVETLAADMIKQLEATYKPHDQTHVHVFSVKVPVDTRLGTREHAKLCDAVRDRASEMARALDVPDATHPVVSVIHMPERPRDDSLSITIGCAFFGPGVGEDEADYLDEIEQWYNEECPAPLWIECPVGGEGVAAAAEVLQDLLCRMYEGENICVTARVPRDGEERLCVNLNMCITTEKHRVYKKKRARDEDKAEEAAKQPREEDAAEAEKQPCAEASQ